MPRCAYYTQMLLARCAARPNLDAVIAHLLLANRQLILPLRINLTLLEEALTPQPLPIGLVSLLTAVFLFNIQWIVFDLQEILKLFDVLLRCLELARRCIHLWDGI
jgi:hypothetical protein